MKKASNDQSCPATRSAKAMRGGLIDQLGRENRLKELRMKALMNQRELAKRSGVSPWTISKIEHGQRLPQIGVAYLLAQALGVRIEDIFFCRDIGDIPIISDSGRKEES